jgi:predicted Na+-dependent transporter
MNEIDPFKTTLRKVGHLVSGFVIFLKGYSKVEEAHLPIGLALILLGVLFASFGFFHEKISWIKRHEAWLMWLESLAIALVAYSYFSAGKVGLPITYAIASLVYLVVGIYTYKYREAI